ncbi:3'-5' exonuclease [Geobacillus sp. ZGt-1]|uniref:3'-5' exonuclease n=1 Tax=Geobacillus sp. ZGt-1 TaxID=1631556 RepID=UPI0035100BE9
MTFSTKYKNIYSLIEHTFLKRRSLRRCCLIFLVCQKIKFYVSKGLEFDVAMIIDLNNDTVPLPSEEAENDDETEYMDIERRLLYVSMTRAKLILYMFYYGKPSVFLDEMDSALYEVIEM